MAMSVDDFKKLVGTLGLPEDVKDSVLEAVKDRNTVPYEWDNETHLGAEIVGDYGCRYILYNVDDAVDFYALALDDNGYPEDSDAHYIGRNSGATFTGRKAIMVDTRLPESVDGIEAGEIFAAEVNGEKAVAIRRHGIELRWLVIDSDGEESLKPDSSVKLLHRLVEAK